MKISLQRSGVAKVTASQYSRGLLLQRLPASPRDQQDAMLLAMFLFLAATHCAIPESGVVSSNQACRPINATIAAEKDDCPVCMAITTTICSGYCKTKELLWKPLFPNFIQKVCTYKEVQYETALLQGCPPDVDPSFIYPVAVSCHCHLCDMDSSDCTVQGIGPDSCNNQNRLA